MAQRIGPRSVRHTAGPLALVVQVERTLGSHTPGALLVELAGPPGHKPAGLHSGAVAHGRLAVCVQTPRRVGTTSYERRHTRDQLALVLDVLVAEGMHPGRV